MASRRGSNLGMSGRCEGQVWLSLCRDGARDLAPPGAGGDRGHAATAISKGVLIKQGRELYQRVFWIRL